MQRRATRHNMLQGVGQLKIPEQLKEDIRDKLLEEGAATAEDAATATVSIQTKDFVFYHYIYRVSSKTVPTWFLACF